jgi:hypothetical protein
MKKPTLLFYLSLGWLAALAGIVGFALGHGW